ncbi:SDR family NAD(P)-dependent oxidoreductase [Actinoalloteichus sp. AHMU CJ021]|uniref:SDR family NAD(P)-dependent oxidoreductase n=1 Tax=Actinoalloteichus sp. AHMU CJ021 TaxID=2072503 RepID=UPI00307C8A11
MRAGDEVGCSTVEDLTLYAPLVLPETEDGLTVQVVIDEGVDGTSVAVYSRVGDAESWTRHATGTVSPVRGVVPEDVAGGGWPPAGAREVDTAGLYPELAAAGLDYGPLFQGVSAAWRHGEDVLAEVVLPEGTNTGGFGGLPVEWVPVGAGPAAFVDLPTYAFQRKRYWPEPAAPAAAGQNAVDSAFWDAVEREDLEALTRELDLDDPGEQRPLWEAVLPTISSWRRRNQEQSTLDSWRYRIAWRPLNATVRTDLSGTWLLVTPDDAAARAAATELAEALAAHGADVVPVQPATPDRETLVALLDERLAAATPRGVLSLLALDERPHPEHPVLPRGAAATLALAQALSDLDLDAPLWMLTRDGVPVDTDDIVSAAQTLVWGLGRVVALETPRRWGGLVDLPARLDERTAPLLCAALAGIGDEDQLAIRPTGVLGRRLVRARPPATPADKPWTPSGTVLVTGGTGGVGAHLARWLAGSGAEHLVLTSRRGWDAPGAADLAAELTELGTEVTIAACDVTDRQGLADLLAGLPERTPLTAVVHAAGAGQFDLSIDDTSLGDFAAVAEAKVAGAVHLDELLGDHPLDAFVLIASAAGVWGSGGQGAYAAANAFLDGLAERRRAAGRVATSISWGAWSEGGMVRDAAEEHMRRRGVPPMRPGLATQALRQALEADETCLVVADVDWARFAVAFASARPRPLIGELPEAQRALEGTGAGDDEAVEDLATFRHRLAELPESERDKAVLALVSTNTAAVLGHSSPDAVEVDRAFREVGFDSVTAVELRNRLATATGLRLPPTLVFDHPTPAALARHLRAEVLEDVQDTGLPVLAEIDRLAFVLSTAATDSAGHDAVTARLRALLSEWTGGQHDADVGAEHDELSSASADEIFDIINKEFGKS